MQLKNGPLAQPDRAPVCGTGGQEFESLRDHQKELTDVVLKAPSRG